MPPKDSTTSYTNVYGTTYTDRQADLTEPGRNPGTRRFQWHPNNPKVTILDFSSEGTCEFVRNVSADHARYVWSKLIKKGWLRKV